MATDVTPGLNAAGQAELLLVLQQRFGSVAGIMKRSLIDLDALRRLNMDTLEVSMRLYRAHKQQAAAEQAAVGGERQFGARKGV